MNLGTITVTPFEQPGDAAQANPLCSDGTNLWMGVSNFGTLTVQKQRPVDGVVLNTYAIGVANIDASRPQVIFFAGSLWFGASNGVFSTGKNVLYNVSLAGTLVATYNITSQTLGTHGINCVGLATDGTLLYALCTYKNASSVNVSTLTALNSSGIIQWSVEFTFTQISGPVFDGTNLWTANWNDGSLTKYSVADGSLVATVALTGSSPAPVTLAFSNGDIFAADGNQNSVWQVNATTNAIIGSSPIPSLTNDGMGSFPYFMQADTSGNLWIIVQDNTASFNGDFGIVIFDTTNTLIGMYDFTGSGPSGSFGIQSSLSFIDGDMFATGDTVVSGNPVLWSMLFTPVVVVPGGPIIIQPTTLPFLPLPACAGEACVVF